MIDSRTITELNSAGDNHDFDEFAKKAFDDVRVSILKGVTGASLLAVLVAGWLIGLTATSNILDSIVSSGNVLNIVLAIATGAVLHIGMKRDTRRRQDLFWEIAPNPRKKLIRRVYSDIQSVREEALVTTRKVREAQSWAVVMFAMAGVSAYFFFASGLIKIGGVLFIVGSVLVVIGYFERVGLARGTFNVELLAELVATSQEPMDDYLDTLEHN